MLQSFQTTLRCELDAVRRNRHFHDRFEVSRRLLCFSFGSKEQGPVVESHRLYIIRSVGQLDDRRVCIHRTLGVLLVRARHSELVKRQSFFTDGTRPEPAAEKIHAFLTLSSGGTRFVMAAIPFPNVSLDEN